MKQKSTQKITALYERLSHDDELQGDRYTDFTVLTPVIINEFVDIYTREGDDWHWLSIRSKGTDSFIATKTEVRR